MGSSEEHADEHAAPAPAFHRYNTLDSDYPTTPTSATKPSFTFAAADAGFASSSTEYKPVHHGGLPPRPSPSVYHIVFRYWQWEIVSLAVSVVLIGAIIGILCHYEGQPMPRWPFSINLNTLIALLATILRTTMLVAAAEVISQAKWDWFSRPRPLSHLNDFESASRGVAGSLKLLFVAPQSTLAIVAALVTISSLAIGPFTQQALRTVACPQVLEEANASIPVAHSMPGRAKYFRIGAGQWEVDVDMKGAMIQAMTNPFSNDSKIVASCETGNCTFPASADGITHSSIAMCSTCFDTTSLIREEVNTTIINNPTNYTLPNGQWVSQFNEGVYLNTRADWNLSWAEPAFTDEYRTVAQDSLLNLTVLSFTDAPCTNDSGKLDCPHQAQATVHGTNQVTDYIATTCAFYPCMQNYHATLTRGVLEERVVSSVPARKNWVEAGLPAGGALFSPYLNHTALKTPCRLDNATYDLKTNWSGIPRVPGREFVGINVDGANYTAPNECLYKLESIYGLAMTAFMEPLLAGACTFNRRQGDQLWCGDRWWLAPFYNRGDATFRSVDRQFREYATAITHKFRAVGGSNYDANEAETARGSVVRSTVCTHFDWRWLLLPIGLTAATGALLVRMILQNCRDDGQPVWKSSLFPLLFHGFHTSQPTTMAGGPRPVMNLDDMRGEASVKLAKFRRGHDAGFVDVGEASGARPRDIDMDVLLRNR
ncbi:hypothetical protein PG985_003691 [Apiospora marii]|uniref:Uncharacterized protein n=1 Tax=Apiospora marii TaxID=335849 RepID=A0ABR1SHC6_9PEZI